MRARRPPGRRAHVRRPPRLRPPRLGPGWALVGDAGYWKDPISAHGLTDALRDAELLARAVVAAAAGEVARARGARRLPGHARPPVAAAVRHVIDTIAAQRWTDDEIPALLLQLSSAMADEVEAIAALDAVGVP